MRSISVSDQTLLTPAAREAGFRQKLEAARKLDHLRVSAIEMPALSQNEADMLLMRSLCSIVTRSVLACHTGITVDGVRLAWDAVKNAARSRLIIAMPVTSAQLEYICHLKPPKALERITELVSAAKALCDDVEFVCEDITRAELSYALEAIRAAVSAGAKRITLYDAAGLSLPSEISSLVSQTRTAVGNEIMMSVRCGDEMHLAMACAAAAMEAGAGEIKTAYHDAASLSPAHLTKLLRARGDDLQISCTADVTRVDRTAVEIENILSSAPGRIVPAILSPRSESEFLPCQADAATLTQAVKALGYELTEEDTQHVLEAVERESKGRALSRAELEAILLSTAQQVPPTYILKSYLVHTGNTITPSAHIVLEKGGETLSGLCAGDGPIDAAFRAIEQIVGRHYEMEDFQIAAVTQNREAMGDALVKLRHSGKIYAGKGISTDINGAAIRAYVNALNKIANEEKSV